MQEPRAVSDGSQNADAIETWNTILFEKFEQFKWVLTRGLAIHGDAAIERLAPAAGARILDVGCGYGDTTIELARLVGPGGSATGVDAAGNFIEVARHEAAGVENARFQVVDVQNGDLGGPYDVAFSRFGTMFFANPAAAMRNVRRALVPGGRLAMTVWRRREDNEWVYAAERIVKERLAAPQDPDQITCGPGPFSMADADVTTTVLAAAGWDRIALERLDRPICLGRTLDEAVDFALAIGPAGEAIRLAGAAGEAQRPELTAAIRDRFAGYLAEDGQVVAPSSVWIVTARA
jgi:SAM-dependent methyltransferase